MPRDISAKKRKFVEEYLANGGNGSAAARSIGYPESRAKQVAWNFLRRDPQIKLALQKELGIALEKSECTIENVVQHVMKLRAEADQLGERYLSLKCDDFLMRHLGGFTERLEVGFDTENLAQRLEAARKRVGFIEAEPLELPAAKEAAAMPEAEITNPHPNPRPAEPRESVRPVQEMPVAEDLASDIASRLSRNLARARVS